MAGGDRPPRLPLPPPSRRRRSPRPRAAAAGERRRTAARRSRRRCRGAARLLWLVLLECDFSSVALALGQDAGENGTIAEGAPAALSSAAPTTSTTLTPAVVALLPPTPAEEEGQDKAAAGGAAAAGGGGGGGGGVPERVDWSPGSARAPAEGEAPLNGAITDLGNGSSAAESSGPTTVEPADHGIFSSAAPAESAANNATMTNETLLAHPSPVADAKRMSYIWVLLGSCILLCCVTLGKENFFKSRGNPGQRRAVAPKAVELDGLFYGTYEYEDGGDTSDLFVAPRGNYAPPEV